MNYFILVVIISVAVEIIIFSNYIDMVKSLLKLTKKSGNIITSRNISDHWKEKVIPKYASHMMKLSFLMLLILLLIVFLLFTTSFIQSNFLEFVFSIKGIISSILLSFSYLYLRNSIKR